MKKSLLDKMAERGADDPLWQDKIDEYMSCWVLRRQLSDDVAARGLYVTDKRGRISENRSVSLSIQASRQMLAILQTLGIKGAVDDSRGSGAYDFNDDL